MEKIYINYEEKECKLGESKFFGSPDLPEDFEWPVDEEEFDMEIEDEDADSIKTVGDALDYIKQNS